MQPNVRERQRVLRSRIRAITWTLIIGLLISGLTAIPLRTEMDLVVRVFGVSDADPARAANAFVKWTVIIRNALHDVYGRHPFMAYGTDWLGFAHIVIAIAFIGALRHPLRNSWLFTWGMIASVMVLPWALIMGELRGIPMTWRMIDCSFGVFGYIACWLASRWCLEMERVVKIENERQ